jgi:hypothetical protein
MMSRGVRHSPTVDHETAVDLGELLCLVTLLLVVVLAFATFRRGPGLMEVAPKHDTFLKGVLDGTLVTGTRLLEHLVEQVDPSGRLPRVPVLDDSDKICVGGVAFRLRLLLGLLLRAMLGGRLGDVFLLASLRLLVLPEDGFDRLLTRGEHGGDVHQLARLGGSLATQLAHQVAASGAGKGHPDDIRVGDVGQLGALLRKPPDVLPRGFPRLLAAASEIPRVPRAHVCALEVSSEGFDQVVPVGDLRRRQMLQLGSGGIGEEQGEVADDEVVIVRSTQLAGQLVVRKPQSGLVSPRVLSDDSRGSEPGREQCPSYGPAESLRTGWFGRGALILPAVVASPTPGVVASAHLLVEAGSTVVAVVLVAEATRGCRRCVPRTPGVDRGFLHESGNCCAMLRGHPCLREAELSACRTVASSRRFLSSPWIRRPSVVDGSGIAQSSIAAAARFWPTPLEPGAALPWHRQRYGAGRPGPDDALLQLVLG